MEYNIKKYPIMESKGGLYGIQDLKRMKKESGMTNAKIAELSRSFKYGE